MFSKAARFSLSQSLLVNAPNINHTYAPLVNFNEAFFIKSNYSIQTAAVFLFREKKKKEKDELP